MTTLLLASNNQHKRSEFEGILAEYRPDLRLVQPRDLDFSFDVVEDGDSFAANALRKAYGLAALLRGTALPGVSCSLDPASLWLRLGDLAAQPLMVIADDSGICVDALDGRPGIHSARYGQQEDQPRLTDTERNRRLLHELGDRRDRGAHYVCNICIVLDHERYVQVEETWHGTILEREEPGETGFGYDPIVWLPEHDCSVAQLSQQQKDRISHRAKATRRALAAALTHP